MEEMHTHQRSGPQVRCDLAQSMTAIAAANLKPSERASVLELLATAHAAELHGSEQLAGAAYLMAAADRSATPAQAAVLRRCATAFVRPKR